MLFFIAWRFARFSKCLRYYIRRVRRLVIGEMDCDGLIDELMSVAEQRQGAVAGLAEGAPQAGGTRHRERQYTAGQYGLVVRGKAFTADQIDALDNTEIEKLYTRYEVRLGAAMTKTLGSAALQIYSSLWAWSRTICLEVKMRSHGFQASTKRSHPRQPGSAFLIAQHCTRSGWRRISFLRALRRGSFARWSTSTSS